MPPGLLILRTFFVAALWNCHHSSNAEIFELNGSTFDERVRKDSDRPWFVKFYAPWCGHCQRLAPLWEELEGKLGGDVILAKVDATVEEGLASEWDVEGFPTLVLIADGKGHQYKGKRTLESLEAFARGGYAAQPEEVGQPAVDATPFGGPDVVSLTGDTFDGAVQGAVPCFVVFHLRSCGHCRNLEAAWSELATALKGQVVVASVDAQANRPLTEHWGVERFPTMKLVTGNEVFEYEGDREIADMKAFALGAFRDSAQAASLPSPLTLASTGGGPAPTDQHEGAGRMHIVVAFAMGMLVAGLVMALLGACTQATKNHPPDSVKKD